jgi:hypothetical protein
LRVFPTDADIPGDQLNTTIDEHFVPVAHVAAPTSEDFDDWKSSLTAELRRVVFHSLPDRIPPAEAKKQDSAAVTTLETETGITVRLEKMTGPADGAAPKRIILFVQTTGSDVPLPAWLEMARGPGDQLYRCEPRGIGETRWTVKNPPNYVSRSHVLLGRTVDTGRMQDVIATARYLGATHKEIPVYVAGEGPGAILASYAAMYEPEIVGVIAHSPLLTHQDPAAPQFLNVLRVADVPELLGLIAPRPLTVVSADERLARTAAVYKAAGAADKLVLRAE